MFIDEENNDKVDIDRTLFEYMINPPNISKWHTLPLDEQALHDVFGFMLVWLLMFEHFNNIVSVPVRLEKRSSWLKRIINAMMMMMMMMIIF